MENTSTGRYLTYTLGKIIFVVIGKLVALQINNSNELRKVKKEETLIPSNLKEDFIATRLNLLETKKIKKELAQIFE